MWSFGVGLTAFDNAVKIEADFGQFTQSQRDSISDLFGTERTGLRYGGNVFGAKIIAQIAYLPFNYFFGHDFDWLSATVSVGANFSYFSESGASQLYESSSIQVLSAALMQIEFPRVINPNWKYFKTWSLYWEPQIWFIPSDVANANVQTWVPTFGVGIRTCVF